MVRINYKKLKKSVEDHESKYWHIKKPEPAVIGFTIIIICIIGLISFAVYNIGLVIDHSNDVKQCEKGMLAIDANADCYALEDWDNYNFGHNIDCVCYYGGYSNLASKEYHID